MVDGWRIRQYVGSVCSGLLSATCCNVCRILIEETAEAYSRALPGLHAMWDSLVGVYVGCMFQEFVQLLTGSGVQVTSQAIVGSGLPYMVGRLSFSFGFSGPCISTDTACSSSLVATHLAYSGLLRGECSAAVAAGANLMLLAYTTATICQLQVSYM